MALLVASMPLLAACEPREHDQAETEARAAEEVPAPAASPDSPAPRSDTALNTPAAQRTIPFQPAPQSDASGTVRISETQTRGLVIGVNLMGLSEGAHAWHIRRAPCGVDGPIVLAPSPGEDRPDSLGEPLRANADGNAAGSMTIAADRVPSGLREAARPHRPGDPEPNAEPLSLQVHAHGDADPGPIVACADLTVVAPPTTR